MYWIIDYFPEVWYNVKIHHHEKSIMSLLTTWGLRWKKVFDSKLKHLVLYDCNWQNVMAAHYFGTRWIFSLFSMFVEPMDFSMHLCQHYSPGNMIFHPSIWSYNCIQLEHAFSMTSKLPDFSGWTFELYYCANNCCPLDMAMNIGTRSRLSSSPMQFLQYCSFWELLCQSALFFSSWFPFWQCSTFFMDKVIVFLFWLVSWLSSYMAYPFAHALIVDWCDHTITKWGIAKEMKSRGFSFHQLMKDYHNWHH